MSMFGFPVLGHAFCSTFRLPFGLFSTAITLLVLIRFTIILLLPSLGSKPLLGRLDHQRAQQSSRRLVRFRADLPERVGANGAHRNSGGVPSGPARLLAIGADPLAPRPGRSHVVWDGGFRHESKVFRSALRGTASASLTEPELLSALTFMLFLGPIFTLDHFDGHGTRQQRSVLDDDSRLFPFGSPA